MKKKKIHLAIALAFSIGTLIHAKIAFAAEPFVVKDIRVEGLQRVEPGTVFSYLPVKVGETFDDTKGADAIRALFNTGFFKDVQVKVDNNVLVVLVEERPTISKVDFTGMKEFEKEAILKALRAIGLADARYFDRALVDKAEQEIKRQYVSKGFYDAEIVTTVTPGERNQVSVYFNIEEGIISKISEINIIGSKAFTEKELKKEMQLSVGGWFSWYSKNDRYSKQKLSADLENIRSFYLNQGYLEFRIDSTQISISPDKKGMYITVNIFEGEQFKIKDIKLGGEMFGKEEELKALIPLKPGDIFSSAKLNAGSKAIADALSTYGYAFASITPQPDIRRDEKLVDMLLVVDPGKRAYVKNISIAGNAKTRDSVIRREIRQLESSWYDGEKIKLSKDRINRLGYFTEVDIATQEVPGSTDQVDLGVRVTEKPSGSLSLGAGFSSSEGVVLSAGINQENAFGTGTSIGFNINTSQVNRTLVLSQFDPYFTEDGISRYSDLYYRTSRPLYYLGDSDYSIINTGTSLRFGIPYSEKGRYFVGGALERLELNTTQNSPIPYQQYAASLSGFDPSIVGTSNDPNLGRYSAASYNIPLTIGWAKDSRDSALLPSSGSYQVANAEVAMPIDQMQYYRLFYQHQYFYPLSKTNVLALSGQVGYGMAYGDKPFPITKNYYLGGIGSVRGYTPGSLGPQVYNPTLGIYQPTGGSSKAVFNAEYAFPVPGSGTDKTLRFFVFFDAGNVYDGAPNVGDLRYAYGAGITWISPLGPLKFSYGIPLNTTSLDRIQNFQFQIGTTF
ncbi:MAG: outer membrane protein assembly factor BamA [Betaproteobacteria bacterium]